MAKESWLPTDGEIRGAINEANKLNLQDFYGFGLYYKLIIKFTAKKIAERLQAELEKSPRTRIATTKWAIESILKEIEES